MTKIKDQIPDWDTLKLFGTVNFVPRQKDWRSWETEQTECIILSRADIARMQRAAEPEVPLWKEYIDKELNRRMENIYNAFKQTK